MTLSNTITSQTSLRRSNKVLSSPVEDGTLLMDMDTGDYHHFDAVASRIWDQIDGKTSIGDICRSLQVEYDVEAETCQKDTIAFVKQARAAGLVTPVSE